MAMPCHRVTDRNISCIMKIIYTQLAIISLDAPTIFLKYVGRMAMAGAKLGRSSDWEYLVHLFPMKTRALARALRQDLM
jgi:hypothetical protein